MRPRRWTPRTETFDFSKLWRPRRSTFKTETRPRWSKKRLETKTFRTETTSLCTPPTICAQLDRPVNANFAADSFCTKKLCSRLSLTKVHFCVKKCHVAFLSLPLGGLVVTYAVHLRLIGKHIVDFLLAQMNFFARFYSCGAMSKWKSLFLKGVGQFSPKFQVEGDVLHQPFFVSGNLDESIFRMV